MHVAVAIRGAIAGLLLLGGGLGVALAQDSTPTTDQPGQ